MPVSKRMYSELTLQDPEAGAEDVPARRQHWRRRTAVFAASLALLAVAAATFARSGIGQPHLLTSRDKSPMSAAAADHKATYGASQEATAMHSPGVRVCLELPGVRLEDGHGITPGSGKEAADAHACSDRCRETTGCAQNVFAPGGGCYLFEEAVVGLEVWKANSSEDNAAGVYSSAVCGPSVEMAQHFADVKKQHLAAVQDEWTTAEQRGQDLLKTLQPQDKFALLHGADSQSGFAGFLNPGSGGGNPSAPPLTMNDGPQGFNVYTDPGLASTSTQFPSLLTVAASFSPETSRRYAAAIVEEFIAKGSNVLLGPDLEVARVPSTGRSFESLSGEDPFLGAELVPPFVREVQSKGIIATIKHWLDNNQEIGRMTMNVEVDDRAQHEIYMPPFKAAIDAGAAAVMCSYNKVYGTHACENPKLLKQLLREEIGFRGFVMSDWGATHDAVNSATNGLDVEMPGSNGLFLQLPQLVGQGAVDQATIDTMAGHVLSSMYMAGQFDNRFPGAVPYAVSHADVTSDSHRDVACQTIVDGAVLLKNEGSVLPLATAGKKIAMIGKYCNSDQYVAPAGVTAGTGSPFMGQGSGYVPSTRTVTPMKGFQDLVKDAASIQWSADASAGIGADVAIVCASMCDVHEGWDRMSFDLPEAAELVGALRNQTGAKKVVVLGITPGAVTTEWMAQVDALIMLFMPGEQIGVASAQLFTGAASPGGRLPVTMPPDGWKPIGGYPAGTDHLFLSDQYPGVQPPPHEMYKWGDYLTANFTEGVLVGYRWYDANEVRPAFPFGFGLTYTEFEFKDFAAECADGQMVISLKVANVGGRDGDAVPQVYVSFPSLLPAKRQLKGFKKLNVQKGTEAFAVFVLGPEDMSYYDVTAQRWMSAAEKKESVTVSVGSSSADLLWSKSLACGGPSDIKV